jgi:hypothetical protein
MKNIEISSVLFSCPSCGYGEGKKRTNKKTNQIIYKCNNCDFSSEGEDSWKEKKIFINVIKSCKKGKEYIPESIVTFWGYDIDKIKKEVYGYYDRICKENSMIVNNEFEDRIFWKAKNNNSVLYIQFSDMDCFVSSYNF